MKTGMKTSEEVIDFILSNQTHFLRIGKPGIFKKAPYTETTYRKSSFYSGKVAFGRGAKACVSELYMGESVVYAFTCCFKSWRSDDEFLNSVVCLTNKARAIVGYEESGKSEELQLYSRYADEIKWKRCERRIYGDRETWENISFGSSSESFKVDFRDDAKKIVDKILETIKKYC